MYITVHARVLFTILSRRYGFIKFCLPGPHNNVGTNEHAQMFNIVQSLLSINGEVRLHGYYDLLPTNKSLCVFARCAPVVLLGVFIPLGITRINRLPI